MDRKKYIALIITFIVTGVTALFSVTDVRADTSAAQEEKETSGYAGEWKMDKRTGKWSQGTNITWTYDAATKTLFFSGTGDMMSNSGTFYVEDPGEGTWYIWSEETEHVVIGEGITTIGSCDFCNFHSLVDVSFPRSLQYIGAEAFARCYNTSFNSITIPGNVKVVDDGAFYQCWHLKEITIEDGVEKIGVGAFCATHIEEITFPESVWKYGGYVLDSCQRLKKVTLSSDIKEIPAGFFKGCTSLQEISIPKSVKKIGNYAFSGTGLKSIKLPKNLEEIRNDAFRDTPLKSIQLPKTIKKIGLGAFYGTFLKTIEIPKHVEEMGLSNKWGWSYDGVFSGMKKLKTVKIKSRKLKKVKDAFEKFPSKAVIIVPKGKKKSYSKMFYKAGLSKKVKIKESKTW